VIRRRALPAKQNKETRAMLFTFSAILGPLCLAYALIALDMRNDLSSLKPKQRTYTDGAVLLGWADLDPDSLHTSVADSRQLTSKLPEGRVRMPGYMMDGYKPVPDGALVRMFVLMPEAGQFLHPAHRVAAQMVEVWLKEGTTIRYADRSLIWVSGFVQRVQEKARMANYVMTSATVEPATEKDLSRWFTP
jgi:hypothetical protein